MHNCLVLWIDLAECKRDAQMRFACVRRVSLYFNGIWSVRTCFSSHMLAQRLSKRWEIEIEDYSPQWIANRLENSAWLAFQRWIHRKLVSQLHRLERSVHPAVSQQFRDVPPVGDNENDVISWLRDFHRNLLTCRLCTLRHMLLLPIWIPKIARRIIKFLHKTKLLKKKRKKKEFQIKRDTALHFEPVIKRMTIIFTEHYRVWIVNEVGSTWMLTSVHKQRAHMPFEVLYTKNAGWVL